MITSEDVFLDSVKKVVGRIEFDMDHFQQQLETFQKTVYKDDKEGHRAALKDNAQILIDCSVLMTVMISLKVKVNRSYNNSGIFSFKATINSINESLKENIGNLRSIMYALQERSKSLRDLHGHFGDLKSTEDPIEST